MGPLTDKIGRKWSLMISGLYFGASFHILGFCHEIEYIYVARFLQVNIIKIIKLSGNIKMKFML